MASELYVETLKGLTSGANANKVIIPSGQTLDVSDWSPPAGTVLQVVQTEYSTPTTLNNTGAYSTLFSSGVITPASSSSKFLIQIVVCGRGAGNDKGFGMSILRTVGGTGTTVYASGTTYDIYNGSNTGSPRVRPSWHYIDAPGTSSDVTYSVQVQTYNNRDYEFCNASNISSITVMEIAG